VAKGQAQTPRGDRKHVQRGNALTGGEGERKRPGPQAAWGFKKEQSKSISTTHKLDSHISKGEPSPSLLFLVVLL